MEDKFFDNRLYMVTCRFMLSGETVKGLEEAIMRALREAYVPGNGCLADKLEEGVMEFIREQEEWTI